MPEEPRAATYFRNFIFGVEDSLVSTVGFLSGVAVASTSKSTLLIVGVVLIFVEAFSMGAGSFLSERSAEDYVHRSKKHYQRPLISSLVMFGSYFIAGFIPLFPYLVFRVGPALWISIAFSLVSLFILGVVSGKITKVQILKSGFRMLIIGGAAIIIGVGVGRLLIALEVGG